MSLAFLEDLAFMLDTGESFSTAAARFGIGERGLQRGRDHCSTRVAALNLEGLLIHALLPSKNLAGPAALPSKAVA